MKKIISIISTVFVLALSFQASATEASNPLKDMNAMKIALTYVEAITLGNTEFNKYLFTADFEYRIAASDQVCNRATYLNFLKSNKGLKYNCKTSYEMLDQTGPTCVGKATMKFDNFTRVDYITLLKTDNGWKINRVVTTYT